MRTMKSPCTPRAFRLAIDALDDEISTAEDGHESLTGEATRLPDGRVEIWSSVFEDDVQGSLHHLLTGMGVEWVKKDSPSYRKRYFVPPSALVLIRRLAAGLDQASGGVG